MPQGNNDEGLLLRLRKRVRVDGRPFKSDAERPINPDGPEAADRIEALTRTQADDRKRIGELEAALYVISEMDGPNKGETVRQIHEIARASLSKPPSDGE